MRPWRGTRFPGAGSSADLEFNRQLRQNIRDDWKVWFFGAGAIAALAVWSFYLGDVAGRVLAGVSGFLLGIMFVVFSLGGHISAFRWWIGAEGERDTAKVIERLGAEWHCEHDLVHQYGNFDHVLVGPPGVFLLDSKVVHGAVSVDGNGMRSGRLVFHGGRFRGSALSMKRALEERLGERAPWVQAVVVIWADFPQARHEEEKVIYIRGDRLQTWLESLPATINAPRRSSLVTALAEVRHALAENAHAQATAETCQQRVSNGRPNAAT
jgi:hypothetical protein